MTMFAQRQDNTFHIAAELRPAFPHLSTDLLYDIIREGRDRGLFGADEAELESVRDDAFEVGKEVGDQEGRDEMNAEWQERIGGLEDRVREMLDTLVALAERVAEDGPWRIDARNDAADIARDIEVAIQNVAGGDA